MQKNNQRRHKRFKLDLVEVNGKMSLTDKVEILDISRGGIALKADRRLDIGKEYTVKLQERGKTLDVRVMIVRCELSGMEQKSNGDSVSIYTAGAVYKAGATDKIAEFLQSIEQSNKEEAPVPLEQRLNVRFDITTTPEKILSYPAQFRVKKISLGGMLINTAQCLDLESLIPMELSFDADKTVDFIGRVASCHKSDAAEAESYEIGVEFTDMTLKNRTLIKTFIDYLGVLETSPDANRTTSGN